MDLKMRFTQNKPQQLNNSSKETKQQYNPLANAFNNRPKQHNRQGPVNNNIRAKSNTGLNKFKKNIDVGAAPKGQFKKYLVESNNIFYEERKELKDLEKIKLNKWVALACWAFLTLSYVLIGSISKFQGYCPAHARCLVFVRCNEYFEYDGDRNECLLSSSIADEIQDISLKQIRTLQYEYGTNECNGSEEMPSLNIRNLFNEIQDKDKWIHYNKAAFNFFQSRQNQKQYGFTLRGFSLVPTIKTYPFSCSINSFLAQYNMYYVFLIALLLSILLSFFFTKYSKYSKEKSIYGYLKRCVERADNKTLNVTHALQDVKLKFGEVNEEIWSNVNDLRAKDKQIGYYEDDFLYWKIA